MKRLPLMWRVKKVSKKPFGSPQKEGVIYCSLSRRLARECVCVCVNWSFVLLLFWLGWSWSFRGCCLEALPFFLVGKGTFTFFRRGFSLGILSIVSASAFFTRLLPGLCGLCQFMYFLHVQGAFTMINTALFLGKRKFGVLLFSLLTGLVWSGLISCLFVLLSLLTGLVLRSQIDEIVCFLL